MRRFLSKIAFTCTMLAASAAFAQQGLQTGQFGQTGQTGLQAEQPVPSGPQTPPPSSRVPRQGSSFDRVATVRHQVAVGPARVGRGSAQPPVTSLGQTQRATRPLSVRSRSSAHTFYPGMRGSQSPNMNVPQSRRRNSRYMTPGMFMNPGAGMMGPARPPARIGR
jgi:hypothetical protein